jgi:hypothetical protein
MKKIQIKNKTKTIKQPFADGWVKNEWNCLPLYPFFSVVHYMQI